MRKDNEDTAGAIGENLYSSETDSNLQENAVSGPLVARLTMQILLPSANVEEGILTSSEPL